MKLKEKIAIRAATKRDLRTLKRFWLNLAKEMFEIEKYIVPSEQNAKKWISFVFESIKEAKAIVLLAEMSGKPIGFIHLSFPREEKYQISIGFATIHEIYVKPAYRRLGVGNQLMKETLRIIKERNFKNVRLSVISRNVEAVQFYKKFGFKIYRYGMLRKLS
jgi:ribosomal protein S18 acetylase RimI-like enzyme